MLPAISLALFVMASIAIDPQVICLMLLPLQPVTATVNVAAPS
jgi:hypothetical protein